MATRSTKFKFSNLSKAVCLLLATLLFSLGTWCAVELGVGSILLGPGQYFANDAVEGRQSFTATPAFERILEDDVGSLQYLASADRDAYEKAYAKAQKETVEAIVDQYMARQKYLKQQNMDPTEEPFYRSPTVHLKTAGIDDDTLSIDFEYDTMALSEDEIRAELNRQYDTWEDAQLDSLDSDRNDHALWLKQNGSLRYYVRAVDGSVYTNLSGKPSVADVKGHAICAGKDSKRSFMKGIDYLNDQEVDNVLDGLPEGTAVYFWVNDPAGQKADLTLFRALTDENDEYIAARQMYDVMKGRPAGWILAIMIFSYLAALALLLWFLHLAGHRNEDPVAADGSPEPVRYAKDGSRLVTAAIDKLPGDVHFLLFAILFGVCLGLPLAAMTEAADSISAMPWLPLGGALTAAVCFLLLAEWLASVCRTVKSGRGYWKHTLVGRLCSWLGRNGKYIANHWKEAVANAKYAPKQLPKRVYVLAIGYILVNIFLVNMMVHLAGPAGFLFFLLLMAFNLVVLVRVVRYLQGLDRIIEASGADADVKVDQNGLPTSLKTLAGNLTVTRETMDKAVEKAVQEERTRTELITNVTHDLKTPLTSLINYSGLLDRKAEAGELGDEESVQYVGVIHDQSEKLKHLIEDLLEASKASAGNVPLHCTPLNLTELAAQAIAEFAPEMEKNGNEIVFTGADGQPVTGEHIVYADGQQTYRVLSNLLSNALKYSAPNTRIYASVADGPAATGNGTDGSATGTDGSAKSSTTTIFELKNTSAEPLNISAEELMQRFVRGDRSRGETEGHGLGLSIAKDLVSLMGGSLSLDIDGDLFKATVTLPKVDLS